MDRANERLLAAATSGDLEQLQVTCSDQVMPRVRPMLDQAAGLRLVQLLLGTGAEVTHQDGYGTPLARVDDLEHADGGQLLLRSAGARHTHWASLIVDSGPYP
jgi:hypothetical protein